MGFGSHHGLRREWRLAGGSRHRSIVPVSVDPSRRFAQLQSVFSRIYSRMGLSLLGQPLQLSLALCGAVRVVRVSLVPGEEADERGVRGVGIT
eukprot:scaffold38343_cov26-Tisochrysis_lutea.AAC.5